MLKLGDNSRSDRILHLPAISPPPFARSSASCLHKDQQLSKTFRESVAPKQHTKARTRACRESLSLPKQTLTRQTSETAPGELLKALSVVHRQNSQPITPLSPSVFNYKTYIVGAPSRLSCSPSDVVTRIVGFVGRDKMNSQ